MMHKGRKWQKETLAKSKHGISRFPAKRAGRKKRGTEIADAMNF
jgi:hypothetical protein